MPYPLVYANVCRKWANSWFPITRLCFNHKFSRNQGSEIRIYLVEKKKVSTIRDKIKDDARKCIFSHVQCHSVSFDNFCYFYINTLYTTIEDTFWLTAARQIVISYNQSSDITERVEIILFEYVILTAWCHEIQICDMSKLSLIKVKFHRMNKLERRARKAFQIKKKGYSAHTHTHIHLSVTMLKDGCHAIQPNNFDRAVGV